MEKLKGNQQSIHTDVKEFLSILALNILKQLDFSDIIKSKKKPLCHKQRLCDKREDCLEKACKLYNAEALPDTLPPIP